MSAKLPHCIRARIHGRFRSLVFLLLATSLAARASDAPRISKVEPPNWWTGYVSPVMVLLTGEGLQGAQISTRTAGVRIRKTQVQPDGEHAFLWLQISNRSKAADLSFHIKTAAGATVASLQLAPRL